MSFQPVLAGGGLSGWAFLSRTRETQQAAFDASAPILRDSTYFEEKIGSIRTAEELVGDRRLLRVALGAFGLQDDIDNRYFLRRVLEEGTFDDGALANRLSDSRYRDFARAFGFGDLDPPRTVLSDFGAEITAAYRERQFEVAVGAQDETMRLAMGLDRALDRIIGTDTTANGRWFAVMGELPVRRVFEGALGLPASTGALDIDRQLTIFRTRSEAAFGSAEVSGFGDPSAREALVRRFLLNADSAGSPVTGPGSAALTLLSQAARPFAVRA